jgi:hypothetical protein
VLTKTKYSPLTDAVWISLILFGPAVTIMDFIVHLVSGSSTEESFGWAIFYLVWIGTLAMGMLRIKRMLPIGAPHSTRWLVLTPIIGVTTTFAVGLALGIADFFHCGLSGIR